MIPLILFVLLIQILLFTINAIGAKAINEVVCKPPNQPTTDSHQYTNAPNSYGSSQHDYPSPPAKMHKTNSIYDEKCYGSRER